MAVSKVILNGETLMDVTVDTVTSEKLLSGYQATGRDGVKVQGAYVPQSVELAVGNADPSESAQHITPPSGYDGFEYFDVGAVSSNYVGSNIAQRSSSDLTASGSVVTAPSGYYAAAASKAINAGSATTPATSITTTPIITVSSTGLVTAAANSSKSITPTVSAGYISLGTAGTVTASGSNTLQLSTQSAATINPTESVQTAVASGKYTTGVVSVGAISSNYIGSNIPQNDSSDLTASGSKITVPSGYYAAVASKTIAAGSAKTPATTITANPGITVSATGLITATNSKTQNVTPTVTAGYVSAGTSGTITVDGSNTSQLNTQTAAVITPTESEQTAVTSGKYTTGVVKVAAIPSDYVGSNVSTHDLSDLSVSGAVVSVPSGYYAAAASTAILSGSATTPSTTIEAIPNINVYQNGKVVATVSKSQNITPSISTGYISTGTAGKITASGSKEIYLETKSGSTITPTEESQIAVASGKYTTGNVTVAAIPSDYIGSAIASVSVVEGTTTVSGTTATRGDATWSAGVIQAGSMGAATFANSSSGQTQYVDISNTTEAPVLVSGGYLYINKGYTDDLKISLAKLVPDGASADLVSGVILSGYAAYDNDGNLVAGNIPSKSSANVTVAGPTVSIPSGYYSADVEKTVASGVIEARGASLNPGVGSFDLDTTTGVITVTRDKITTTAQAIIISAGYLDTTASATAAISVSSNSKTYALPTISAATIIPTETSQVAAASGKFTLGDITVAAVSSDYIGSNIAQNSAADVIAAGPTVSIPSGYYNADVSKTIAAAAYTTSFTGTLTPAIAVDSTGLVTVIGERAADLTAVWSSGYIESFTLRDTTTVNSSYQLSTQSAVIYTPSSSTQTIPSGVYLTGAQTIAGDSNFIASNIAEGVIIFGITGTYSSGPSRIAVQETLVYFYGASVSLRNLNTFGSVQGATLIL